MEANVMFLDCPAYLDQDGAARCGLPAEVRCRFIMRSTDGPLESAMIRCPAGHWFNGAIESLTCERADKDDPVTAAAAPGAGFDTLEGTPDGHDSRGGLAVRSFPAKPCRQVPRPCTAPAYYLGRPAGLWISAMRPRRGLGAANHQMESVTLAGNERSVRAASRQPAADPAVRVPLTLA
jgi:hypothetical protein